MEGNIEELENRYQALFGDFQSGKLNEAAFVAAVDNLQFKDDWGRYWMLGAQSGAWHYYDGQAWHQADPRDADNLPFMDDQGRYWQRGSKSGDWYYYQAETGEWVKPGEGDDIGAPSLHNLPAGAQSQQWQNAQSTAGQPQPAYGYNSPQSAGGNVPASGDAQLFQDDDGRYWAVGAKTGEWYFYDEYGWHPAHEFQGGTRSQPQQPAYQPQSAAYAAPPQQPYYQPAQSTQGYAPPSEQSAQTIRQESRPASVEATPAGATPPPPQGASQSGTWYFFDGDQWLKYSTGEPADQPPPDPGMILDQELDAPAGKTKSKSEPIVAEFFEDDEPPVEVVDVEVITVVEAEPDIEPEPAPLPPEPASTPREPASVAREPASVAREPVRDFAAASVAVSASAMASDEVRPRRSRTSAAEESPAEELAVTPEPRKRTPSDPVRPVTPRKKTAAHEPTIIIPTGATASGISSPSSARVTRPPQQRSQTEQRRAREATLPLTPVPLPDAGAASVPTSVPTPGQHRQVTQTMPVVARTSAGRTESTPIKTTQRTRQSTDEIKRRTPTPVPQPVQPAEPQKQGYTFGEVLRSFPSTFWTWTAGIAVLVIVAVFIIAIGAAMLPFNDSDTFGVGVAAVESPTPTLDAALPDATPTLGPTPTGVAETLGEPTPASLTNYSSADLVFTLEYPETWQIKEETAKTVFSPSEAGLNSDAPQDSNIRIGVSEDDSSSISDLLANVLAEFPADAETLNEGTISIASQTWTSTQIRFDDENLGGQGIATLAVTNKDGVGYYLIAAAAAEQWNTAQPLFQGMINSFRFGQFVAQATPNPTPEAVISSNNAATETAGSEQVEEATPEPVSTPEPEVAAAPVAPGTPVVHVVQSGDTLIGIAIQYGVDVDLLASENGITDPGSLSLGQELTIPFTAEELAQFNAGNTGTTETTASATGSGDQAEASETASSGEAGAGGETASESSEEASAEEEIAPEIAPPGNAAPVSGRIAYPAYNRGKNSYDLWMVDLATGEQVSISSNASQPAFNKDGSLLAYRSWDLGTRGIFFRDFVGGRGGKVTDFVEDGMPTWSPDSFTFAFASRKEGDRVPRIYVGNQLGEDPFGLAFQGEYPSTFPDGRLVVKGCTPSGDCGIFTMGPSGGGEKKISGEVSDTAPAPSPDGSKVAFMSNGRGGNNWEIWVMNADGSNPKRLTENGNNDGLPAWSPDGQSIAYVSDQGGVWSIWVMNADGSNQRKAADMNGPPDGIVLHDEPNSRGWLEERISWAP